MFPSSTDYPPRNVPVCIYTNIIPPDLGRGGEGGGGLVTLDNPRYIINQRDQYTSRKYSINIMHKIQDISQSMKLDR